MSIITSSLYAATSGLNAAQAGIDLISRNIANANTDGYTRKYLNQSTLILDGQARGVHLDQITRNVDADMQKQLMLQISVAEQSAVQGPYLERLENVFGTPNASTSMASRFVAIKDALAALSSNPDSTTAQRSVLNAADSFTRSLHQLGDQIVNLRNQTENGIANTVNRVNQLAVSIDELNDKVVRQQAAGLETADLQDQRDQVLKELSKLIPVTWFTTDTGALWVSAGHGQSLVDSEAHAIEFSRQTVSADSSYTYPTVGPSNAPNLSGLTLGGVDITTSVDGGQLAGLFELRDQLLPQAQAQVDEFAAVATTTFEAAGITLFTDPANGSPLPYPAATVGLASRLQVNQQVIDNPWQLRDGTAAAVESANTGDSTLILSAITAVFDTAVTLRTTGLGPGAAGLTSGLGGSSTLSQYARDIIGFQSSQISEINSRSIADAALVDQLQTQLTDQSGVNIDQQLAQLIQLQASYSASAKTIQTLQRLFDDLLNVV